MKGEGYYYVKMGMLLGRYKPILSKLLLECDTLDEMRVLINGELGTNIVKGMLLPEVVEQIEDALNEDGASS